MGLGHFTHFLEPFAKLFGLFVLSPLFSKKGMGFAIRIGLALILSLVVYPLSFSLVHTWKLSTLVLELLLGYLTGLFTSLIIEAGSFSGQVIGTFIGLSGTELFYPPNTVKEPLMSRLFSFALFAIFLALDLHHVLLKLLFSESAYPRLSNFFDKDALRSVYQIVLIFLNYSLEFILIPFFIFLLLTLITAFLSRMAPNIPFFLIIYPLQIFLGLYVVSALLPFFVPLLKKAFYDIYPLLFPL